MKFLAALIITLFAIVPLWAQTTSKTCIVKIMDNGPAGSQNQPHFTVSGNSDSDISKQVTARLTTEVYGYKVNNGSSDISVDGKVFCNSGNANDNKYHHVKELDQHIEGNNLTL